MAGDRAFDDAMPTSLPASPMPLSSNVGSPNGSLLGTHSTTMEENQRNIRTDREVAATHAERIQTRKLLSDAFPDSGLV